MIILNKIFLISCTGTLSVNDKRYTISVFDTAGQQDYTGIRGFSYSASDVVVVCFSMAERESFRSVQEVWIPEIRTCHGYKKPVILVGTQKDCKSVNEQVKTEEGQSLAKTVGAVHFLECTSSDLASVSKISEQIVTVAVKFRQRRGSIIKKLMRKIT